ncbi:hypothetical protein JYG34_14525 [Pseudomonas entomophila]|nr:hypothetical protein JYG34_14525 [Pseudomonas entomophila]
MSCLGNKLFIFGGALAEHPSHSRKSERISETGH